MTAQQTYPGLNIDIQDNSQGATVQNTILPVHLPHFAAFAATGPANTPVLGDYGTIKSIFGADTFDARGLFFQHPTLFALQASQYQQVYFTRLVDPSATTGSLVLLCSVTPVAAMVQYQRGSTGAFLLGSNGLPLPQLMVDGTTPVTAPGIKLTFTTRQLAGGETFDSLVSTSAQVSGQTVVTYPILATAGSFPGSAINNSGFSLYYTPNNNQSIVSNIGALTYRFAPQQMSPSLNIASAIFDIFNESYNDFSFKPAAFDATTSTYYDLPDVISNNYFDTTTKLSRIPFQVYVYSNNVQTIANAALAVSPELGTNPWLVNLFSAIDASGNPYSHVQVASSTNSVLNSSVVLYNIGGTDGSLSKTMLETLTVEYFSGATNPLIADKSRYPFTHIYDSGYSLSTKMSLLDIWTLRDDIKIDFSTQDVANAPNTQAQDQSTGSSLRAAILLYPESLNFGTQAIRASIYQQTAKLSASATLSYNGYVPSTLDRLIKRCLYDGATYIKGSPKGRPYSEVTVFNIDTINWTPVSGPQKQLSWDTGLNYIQFGDVNTLFFADLRSVYPIDSSLLSDDVFVDRLVYIKHIALEQWTIFAGREDPPKNLFDQISKSIDKAIYKVMAGKPVTTTTVYQTDQDKAVGYATTISIAVAGNIPNRIWNLIIPVSRAS